MANSEFKNLCGVWLSEPKEGKARYMSGALRAEDVAEILSCANEGDGTVRLFIHKINKRPDRNDPDYRISCVASKPKEAEEQPLMPLPNNDDVPF